MKQLAEVAAEPAERILERSIEREQLRLVDDERIVFVANREPQEISAAADRRGAYRVDPDRFLVIDATGRDRAFGAIDNLPVVNSPFVESDPRI